MPVYEFQCKEEHISERYLRITDEIRHVQCDICGKGAKRIISRPTVRPDIEAYLDENLVPDGHTGGAQLVTSRQHKRELLKQHGLREVEPSYETKARRQKGTFVFDGGKERSTNGKPPG